MSGWQDEWLEANRASWDELVPIHFASEFYDVEGFKAGWESLHPFEITEVGDVSGKELLHLQCHFGMDTLCWARRGAHATGLDFSAPAVEKARELAAELALEAEFVETDVYAAADALSGRAFDVVYTSTGALGWLPDIRRWAEVVVALLRPGGFLYLAEFHPFSGVFGDDLTIAHDYFQEEPEVSEEPGSYANPDAGTVYNRTYQWDHTLGGVVSAVAGAGLTVELLHEHDYVLFPAPWPFLEKSGDGTYRLPEGAPDLPLMYSLRARKDGS